jgi:8-oxo-dGTP pyrophosphatase MutT (NUDIX family)
MAQKYKVFFYENILIFSTNIEVKKVSTILYKYTDLKELQSFLFDYLIKEKGKKIRVVCTNPTEVWEGFCKFFEVRVAAGGLVINPKGDFLFIKRKGLWDLPKGHLEKGESKEAAALREVEEECGISGMTIAKPIVTTYHTYWLNDHQVLKPSHWFLMDYKGSLKTKPQTKEGITEAVWVSEEMIAGLLENSYPSISQVIKKWKKCTGEVC